MIIVTADIVWLAPVGIKRQYTAVLVTWLSNKNSDVSSFRNLLRLSEVTVGLLSMFLVNGNASAEIYVTGRVGGRE